MDRENIEEILKKLAAEDVPAEVHKISEETAEQFSKSLTRPRKHILWSAIMKSRVTKLAAAAVIIIAVLVGIYHFSGSIDGTSVAWAEVAEKVEQVHTFVYRMKLNMTGMEGMPQGETTEVKMVAYNSPEYGVRMDAYVYVPEKDEKITQTIYVVLAEEAVVTVIHEQKQYVRIKLTNELVDKMREESGDPKEMVKKFMECEYTELGRKTINGIEVEGIESNEPRIGDGMFDNVVGRLWVGVETGLPVQMEMEYSANDGSMQMWMVMDEFEWDVVELDASVFEPNIPDDYTLMADVEMPETDVEGVIKGLSVFAELAGGQYPSSLGIMTAMKEAGEVFRESIFTDPNREPNKPPSQEQRNEMMSKLMSVQAVCMFYAELVRDDKEPAYYGDKVTAEFGHVVLMRWKIIEGKYRVIFGDLTVEDVTAEELAELESMPLNIEPYAIKPQPAEGAAVSASIGPGLSWMPGAYVTEHKVYFGTSADELSLLAEVTEPNFAGLPALEADTTYYWRVEEVQADGSVAASDIWSFNTGKLIGWWGWWKLDEDSGDIAYDSSGNGYDGRLNNMDDGDWVDGALYFDGNDSFVSIPPLNLNSNTVTISAWIKRDGEQAESYTGIVYSRDGRTIAGLNFGGTATFEANNKLAYNWNETRAAWGWDSGLIIPGDEWVFVVLVVEPAKATLYLGKDGTLSSAINEINHRIEEFDGVTRIGHDVHTEGRYFKGTIDDVRIYNYALSWAEVEALYEDTLGTLTETE